VGVPRLQRCPIPRDGGPGATDQPGDPPHPKRAAPGPKQADVQRFLTPEQVEAVAAQLRPPYGLMVVFLAYTGIRAGELAGLDVGDLRFIRKGGVVVGGVVSVERTRHLVGGEWIEAEPKSAKSRRKVPLISWLAADLAEYLETVQPHGDDPSAPLFPHRFNGGLTPGELDWSQPVEPATFRRNLFRTAVKAAGIPGTVRLHDLRHTAASISLTAGMSPYALSEQLGHSSYKLTLDVYARLIPSGEETHALEGQLTRPRGPRHLETA
jgi:integrase